MSPPRNILVFYSRGPHFIKLLRHLRERYPGARITAMVPAGYPVNARLENNCDRVVSTELAAYSTRDRAALSRLRAQIRHGQYDTLYIMFDTIKLQTLARATGIRERRVYTVDGRDLRAKFQPVRRALATGWDRVRGELRYAWIAWVVHNRPVRK